jgi:hypothetical protein
MNKYNSFGMEIVRTFVYNPEDDASACEEEAVPPPRKFWFEFVEGIYEG